MLFTDVARLVLAEVWLSRSGSASAHHVNAEVLVYGYFGSGMVTKVMVFGY